MRAELTGKRRNRSDIAEAARLSIPGVTIKILKRKIEAIKNPIN
jgi:hypothetical protein